MHSTSDCGRRASLHDGWQEVALGDIAEVFAGSTPSTKEAAYWEGGEIVWVTPTDITSLRRREICESARKITPLGLEKLGGRTAPKGAVLVTSRATIGAAAISGCEVALNQGVTALVPHPEVDARWLYYWVALVRDELVARAAGSTFLEISRSKMRQLEVALPPLEEQRRVAELLGHVDSCIEAIEQAVMTLESLVASTRESFVSRPEYERQKLGDVLAGIDAGRSPRCEDRPPGPDEVGVLKISAIRFNEFVPLESKTLPTGADFSPAHFVRKGDLLMSRANGSLHLVGAVCRVDDAVANLLLSDKTLRLRVDPSALDPDFALHALLSRSLRTQIESDATGSSGQKNISQAEIRRLVVPIASLEEQRSIAATLEAFATEARARKAQIRSLSAVRSAILGRLLAGHHRIPESYDRFLQREEAALAAV